METNSNIPQAEERKVVLRQPAKTWAAFDAWMAENGCENLAEGLRVLMQAVVEQSDTTPQPPSQQEASHGE